MDYYDYDCYLKCPSPPPLPPLSFQTKQNKTLDSSLDSLGRCHFQYLHPQVGGCTLNQVTIIHQPCMFHLSTRCKTMQCFLLLSHHLFSSSDYVYVVIVLEGEEEGWIILLVATTTITTTTVLLLLIYPPPPLLSPGL